MYPSTPAAAAPAPEHGTASGPEPDRHPHGGPPLLAPVLAFVALTIGYVVANSSTPRPDAEGRKVLAYARDSSTTIEVGSLLLLASAVPLALLAALVHRRLRALGVTAPGPTIALAGGVLGAAALSGSALFGQAVSRLPMDADPALARALADLSFLFGGVAYTAMFALLLAGVSVTGLLSGLLARTPAWAGLVLAGAGMLSLLSLVADPFNFLLPVVRFGGLVWLVCVAILLPRARPTPRR
ncbi:DUF4386 domain-containing protein [Streptomyces sp. NPDC006992]|uniref:DUF4386 domain-containing protein n=1 Tax=unclassified Streptomyces TaxID=2593676 RepID=UPI0033D9BB11